MKDYYPLKIIGLLAGIFSMRALSDYLRPINVYLDVIPIIGMFAILFIGLKIFLSEHTQTEEIESK